MGKVLELSFSSVQLTGLDQAQGDVADTGEIDLDLLPNQIAEIHKIDSQIQLSGLATDGLFVGDMALSMNPDENDDPSTSAAQARLEFFFNHRFSVSNSISTNGGIAQQLVSNKVMSFEDKPYLVGTNIGITTNGIVFSDTTERVANIWVRVYFTRRKATAQELNQILLKRR